MADIWTSNSIEKPLDESDNPFTKQDKTIYWRQVLERVVEVICTLAERGLAFRGSNETFGSSHNGNYIGLLELIAKFDSFLAAHIAKYGHPGRGHTSYLSKTICEEIIEEMSKHIREIIVQEVKTLDISAYQSI